MDAKVTWLGEMSLTGTADHGFSVPISGTPEDGSPPTGSSPFELVALALASCTALDVISILKKKKQDVTAFEVRVHGERATVHPKVFTHLTLEYIVTGNQIDPAAVERSVWLSTERYCGVHAMLKKSVPIDHVITIREENPNISKSALNNS